ncbi:hypothetical protein SAMN04488136_1753 [Vibrio xiamenensis]|uniref:Phage DNA packaging protein, Nu1 subunit of terminase n=1 Tax=Vibrio xiamenensis TaxID=861298 RepID=A0A1G8I1C4_9VIBR|nr:helix-turn-helix domain-containing protein [Vibrio xiamenensis]SDI12698.1 hypothetical protein SAMN04488136_1753 [Vibrio xiamenensis]
MSTLFNPDKKFTQSDIATLLGISDRQVRTLTKQGILPAAKGRDGINPLECIHRYITYKSQVKTDESKPETDLDDDSEAMAKLEQKLKLEKLKENVAMMRAKRVLFEKSYGPIDVISETLQQLASKLGTIHEGLIPKLKKVWQDMPPEAIEVIEKELTKASNECADVQPDISDYIEGDPEDGPAWLKELEESSSG